MNPIFSIIIPHYDIPDLLMRCLKSIPVSEDIQVIVVDDNSPDADTYLERYPELSRPYLKFIRAPKNGGAGYARNIGMDYAKGEWLLFADADDFFVDDMYDIIASEIDNDVDILFFRKKSVCSDDISKTSDRSAYVDILFESFHETGDELSFRTRYVAPWGKLIRRKLVEDYNLRFDEVKYANDIFFSVSAGVYAQKIKVVDKVLYFLTYRPDSLAADFCKKPGELEVRADVFFRTDKFLQQHDMCSVRKHGYILMKILKQDKKLFKHYFFKLDEIYPTKLSALNDIRKGYELKSQVLLYLNALRIWITH